MAVFARIEAGIVAELFETNADLSTTFHPSLDWRDAGSDVEVGWCLTEAGFEAPQPPSVMPQLTPTLSQLEAELGTLIARFAAIKAG